MEAFQAGGECVREKLPLDCSLCRPFTCTKNDITHALKERENPEKHNRASLIHPMSQKDLMILERLIFCNKHYWFVQIPCLFPALCYYGNNLILHMMICHYTVSEKQNAATQVRVKFQSFKMNA